MLYFLSPVVGAFLAVSVIFIALMGLKKAQSYPKGIIVYYFYAALFTMAAATALTPRDFSINELMTLSGENEINEVSIWLTRFMSIFVGLASLERLVTFFNSHSLTASRFIFLTLFVLLWISTLLTPTLISNNSTLAIKDFYALAFGIAIILSVSYTVDDVMIHARNALSLFLIASLLFIIISPYSALDINYTQGYIPGLPRFFGLSPHAIVMGWMTALTIWLVLIKPFLNKKFNYIILIAGFFTLILTQSKSNIVIFIIGSLPILYYMGNHQQQKNYKYYFNTLIILILFIFLVSASFFFINGIENTLKLFLPPDKVYNVMTLTGRDLIWEIALQEFYKNPLLGYGADLFSLSYRESIGMLNATNAHSQYIDTLARSGLVGFTGLIAFLSLLTIKSLKLAKQTKGLSVSLIFYFLLGSITDVPISLYSIGGTAFSFYLLLFLVSTQEAYSNDDKLSNIGVKPCSV
jgi:O-antigen ligase